MLEATDTRSVEALDEELKEAGVPPRYRPLDCFKKLYGSVPEGDRRQELFEPIVEWYIARYGEAVRWDGIIARFPILIKGQIYLGIARFAAAGETLADYKDEVEQLPRNVASSLTPEEVRLIIEKLTIGSRGFYALYNLMIDDDCLVEPGLSWVRRALYDLENAAVTLKHTGDTQSAIFQSHEAAEKFLKAAFKRADSTRNPKDFGHDIPKLFKKLLEIEPRYSFLALPIENLQKVSPSMEMRYSMLPRSAETAVVAFYGALYICGMLAQMWLSDKTRGTAKAGFKERSFYIDGSNSTFYCKSVQGNFAMLTLFRSSEHTGAQMGDIILGSTQSALYLEVTEPQHFDQLRSRFEAHLRNPGKRISPDEIGLRVVDGSEGAYVTAIIKRRL